MYAKVSGLQDPSRKQGISLQCGRVYKFPQISPTRQNGYYQKDKTKTKTNKTPKKHWQGCGEK